VDRLVNGRFLGGRTLPGGDDETLVRWISSNKSQDTEVRLLMILLSRAKLTRCLASELYGYVLRRFFVGSCSRRELLKPSQPQR
jgi:hypothetical protein